MNQASRIPELTAQRRRVKIQLNEIAKRGTFMAETTTIQAAVLDPLGYRLPDIPEKHPDDMTSAYQLAKGGGQNRLEVFLDRSHPGGRTVVFSELYICATPGSRRRVPDLGVALDADPELLKQNNGYVVENQGKTLDLVMEIASARTWQNDVGEKVHFYAELGIPEYWRFDETGCHYDYKLAGDRLVDGIYLPIPIEELPSGERRGYSAALGLCVCWRAGRLDWYDPVAQDYIPSIESLLELTEQERKRADREAQLRQLAERSADQAELRAETAERQNRELEERLRRLQR